MTFSIFRYAALNKLSEYSSDSDADEVPNIIPGPTAADDVFESDPKNNFEQNDLGLTAEDGVDGENKNDTHEEDVKIDDDTGVDGENKSETVKIDSDSHTEPESDTKIKGGDQVITYDVSFISAFPFIVAKAV